MGLGEAEILVTLFTLMVWVALTLVVVLSGLDFAKVLWRQVLRKFRAVVLVKE